MIILDVLTYLGADIGAVLLAGTLSSASGAPQEAAGAAMAVAFVVIPYCVSATVHRTRGRGGRD